MPARPLDLHSTPDRSYNSETLEWQTASWDIATNEVYLCPGAQPPVGSTEVFYRNLNKVLTEGAAPTISLEQARIRVATMDMIRAAAGITAII